MKHETKKIVAILGLGLFSTILNGVENVDINGAIPNVNNLGDISADYTDEAREATGMIQQDGTKGKKTTDERGHIDDKLLDVVIYNDSYDGISHHKRAQITQPIVKGDVAGIHLATPATDLALASAEQEKKYREEQAKLLAEQKLQDDKPISYYVGGYCTVNTPVKIVRNSEFTSLNCMLDFGNGEYRDADVFSGVYPNYKEESLTVLPIYATFPNQSKVNLDGVVLTSDKASLNIADHVENFKIRKLVSEYGLATNDVAYRYANAYMTQVIASKSTTNVDYISVPDPANPALNSVVPVVTSNTQPPSSADYFALAGIELLSQIISIGAKNMLEDSDPLFRIFKGKRVYLEGVVTIDNKGLGRKFGRIAEEQKNSIQKQNDNYNQGREELIRKYEQSAEETRGNANTYLNNTTNRSSTPYPSTPYPYQNTSYPTTVPQ